MERDYGKKNGEKHAGEKKGEGEYLSRNPDSAARCPPADRSPARVQRWPSAGARRGQHAGSALLRNEAVHIVLPGPRAVSSLVFCSRKACDG